MLLIHRVESPLQSHASFWSGIHAHPARRAPPYRARGPDLPLLKPLVPPMSSCGS